MRTRENLITERAGINHARVVVERSGSLFKEINLQHDFGHDATIILVINGEVQPREVALQVKSGLSYNTEYKCHLPATAGHIDFWARHDLITLGIVYDPEVDAAYWIDLQSECSARKRAGHIGGATISFPKAAWNRFEVPHFSNVLVPMLLGQAPTIPLATALEWARASDPHTHVLGVRTLLVRHKQAAETWLCLLEEFHGRTPETLSIDIPVGFAKLLGHCDIGDYTGKVDDEVRQLVQIALNSFKVDDIAKMLLMLDDDETFDRGQLGYAFLPLLGGRSDSLALISELRDDDSRDAKVRELADCLLSLCRHDPEWWSLWLRAA
ncbi:DUF4365 domain-containing protein [Sphingobium sp. Ant17]|uniref:DUF4365 domain-containing protein n=1 Tax=Sphingobium sp. Ant17 TaxID=1461752 RepID=UPI00044D7909|nr:DUF4365 domain-containing protein [Sphingobium sp. Ant17]EXS68137.1 hypothetical protein BF95_06980 [Sphingobium sp. Ant17]